jgi:hypothetical protein
LLGTVEAEEEGFGLREGHDEVRGGSRRGRLSHVERLQRVERERGKGRRERGKWGGGEGIGKGGEAKRDNEGS